MPPTKALRRALVACALGALGACSRPAGERAVAASSAARDAPTSATALATASAAASAPPPPASSARATASAAAGTWPRCPAPGSLTYFFPARALVPAQDAAAQDAFLRSWYSKHLRAMAEPSLACGDLEGDTFRFLWLRTFHAPVAVRVHVLGDAARCVAVRLDGLGGYEPGHVAERTERALSSAEWRALLEAVERAGFWDAPSTLPPEGLDGAQWIVEARAGARYHVVDRWSPTSGRFRELGDLFLRLSRLAVGDVY